MPDRMTGPRLMLAALLTILIGVPTLYFACQ